MPTQEYQCEADGAFDIHLTFVEDVPKTSPCPDCGVEGRHVLRVPAGGAHFARTWNEQANEARRDPYTQAKAQSWNMYNEQRDMGVRVDIPTEESIQVGAKAVYDSERNPPLSAEQRQLVRIRRDQKARKKKTDN